VTTSRDDELAEFEKLANGLLAKLAPAQRARLLKTMALRLRVSQVRRIKDQVNPEGGAWPARKPRSRDKTVNRPLRFLYRKPGAKEARVADLKSWRKDGPLITGYDREAGAIRSFLRSRVERHLPPEGSGDPGAMGGSIRGGGGRIRRKPSAMFARLRAARNLKAGADAGSAWVEFTDRASRIARIHHYGLRGLVAPGGPEIRYPQRALIGFSTEDREVMLADLIEYIVE
jgi:hypothetical protein